MVGYRRMGNMDHHLANATSTSDLLQQLTDTVKNPRGTVLRIQALALVAIILTFLLATFGSCRRWSNRWIVQKGFLAANVLSLSLGTYSIGLMQSSVVKSELYPVWAVSLLALFGCIDPVTSFNGLEYKSPLSKMLFQLFLYFGYVLLMSISTISSDVGNLAICMLSAITLLKGFHRSMAHVLPRRMQDKLKLLDDDAEKYAFADFRAHFKQAAGPVKEQNLRNLIVDFPPVIKFSGYLTYQDDYVTMEDVKLCIKLMGELQPFHDVCFALSLSHTLQKHLLGMELKYGFSTERRGRVDWAANYRDIIDYKWAFTVIETELSFLYDLFFTGNAFLHYHQAKTASFWALASFMGICFLVAGVAIPGTMNNRSTTRDHFVGIIIVDTTTADRIITLVILVSVALLQLVQLIRCWTSNWARVAVACEYTRKHRNWRRETWTKIIIFDEKKKFSPTRRWLRCMRFKAFVVTTRSRINWFDKYLWQKKLGQYSFIPEGTSRRWCKSLSCIKTIRDVSIRWKRRNMNVCDYYKKCTELVGMQYISQVLWDFFGSDVNREADVRLDDDVKGSITDFLRQTKGDTTGNDWASFLVENGADRRFLPYTPVERGARMPDAGRYALCVVHWQAATWYCELAEQEQEKRTRCSGTAAAVAAEATSCFERAAACFPKQKAAGSGGEREKNRRVAIALSKYCAYLMVSAAELLPGPSLATKFECREVAKTIKRVLYTLKLENEDALEQGKDLFESFKRYLEKQNDDDCFDYTEVYFLEGLRLGQRLHGTGDPWKVLAKFWVQALIYAAPYGEVEAHKQHLSQGGELITHVWAMLYHIGIREWQPGEPKYWDEYSSEDGGHTKVEEEEEISEVIPRRKRVHHVEGRPAPRPSMMGGGQAQEDDGAVMGSQIRRCWRDDNSGASPSAGTWPQPTCNPPSAGEAGLGTQHLFPTAQQQQAFAAGHVGGAPRLLPPPGFAPSSYMPQYRGAQASQVGGAPPPRLPPPGFAPDFYTAHHRGAWANVGCAPPPGFAPGLCTPQYEGARAGHISGVPPRLPPSPMTDGGRHTPHPPMTNGGQNKGQVNSEDGRQTEDGGATYNEFTGPVEDITLTLKQPGSSSHPVQTVNQRIPDLNELPPDNKLYLHDHDLTKDWIKISL